MATSCDGVESSCEAVEQNGPAAIQLSTADEQSTDDGVVGPPVCELNSSYASNCEENLLSAGSESSELNSSTDG